MEEEEISEAGRREVEELMLALARETAEKMERKEFVASLLRSVQERDFPELVAAARKGGRHLVEQFLRSAKGKGILPQAAWNGDRDAVDLLVACGAELHAVDRAGLSALMAASHRGHAAIVQSLLRAQADIEQGLANGTTSLVLAAKFGHVKTVEALLEASARVDVEVYDESVLYLAAKQGDEEVS